VSGVARTAEARAILDAYAGTKVPGLSYVVVDTVNRVFNYAGGWADIRNQQPISPETTLMAYSMTKTFTAVAVLQLAESGRLRLDDQLDQFVPETPYRGHAITLRQLLSHTSGIPNPIPLRWVHLVKEALGFDEMSALSLVWRKHPRLAFEPGRKFLYSNIGYWLLGFVISRASGQSYIDYMKDNVLNKLNSLSEKMDFVIPDSSRHAKGYLAKYSVMNLLKGFVTDRSFWGEYEDNWLELKSHYIDGPAFGGLIGTARGFGNFLQDQLQPQSALLGDIGRSWLVEPQTSVQGRKIPMTLGWHIGHFGETSYLFKEGGGGGFHCEMRLYPNAKIGTVIMTNATTFASSRFLNRIDPLFISNRVAQ
jgi:D-alanyl-D-alanine carboxypeptidase